MSAHQDLGNYIDGIRYALDAYINKANMQKFAKFASDLIRVRTRLGYGVRGPGQQREKLKELSKGYKKQRKSFDGLHSETTPNRSNLTYTGQMLNSIGIIKITKDSVTIGPHGYRNDGLSNEEVANRVSKTRPFNYLTDKEELQLTRFAGNDFNSYIKRELTK